MGLYVLRVGRILFHTVVVDHVLFIIVYIVIMHDLVVVIDSRCLRV